MKVTHLIRGLKGIMLFLFCLSAALFDKSPVAGWVTLVCAWILWGVALRLDFYIERKEQGRTQEWTRTGQIEGPVTGFVPPRPMPPAPAPQISEADRITTQMREAMTVRLDGHARAHHEFMRQQVMLQAIVDALKNPAGEITSDTVDRAMEDAARRAEAVPPPSWSPLLTGQAVLPDEPSKEKPQPTHWKDV